MCIRDRAFGNNTFVVVGASGSGTDWTDPGSIARSTDNGSTFSAVTPLPSKYLFGVAFGNTTDVGIGTYGILVSSTEYGSSRNLSAISLVSTLPAISARLCSSPRAAIEVERRLRARSCDARGIRSPELLSVGGMVVFSDSGVLEPS